MIDSFVQRVACWLRRKPLPPHLRAGQLGEKAAKKYLKKQGLKFLTANFRTDRGEIDLVMRVADWLLYADVGQK
jgi:Holliday junction resolvase-like predicted endonuclease